MAYMPFHIFLAQSLSLLTGGITEWKASKDALAAALALLAVILVWIWGEYSRRFNLVVSLAALYGGVHLLVWALNPDIYLGSAILGTIYNNRLFWYLIIGLGGGYLARKKLNENKLINIVLVISTVICFLGVLQYFLPKDILTHLGYSLERGVKPAFFIDDKPDLPRIMSTLRDPNSLGAYLILPITLIAYRLVNEVTRKRTLFLGLMGLHGLALFLTFSRSAWVGTAISLGVFGAFYIRTQIMHFLRRYGLLLIGFILLIASISFVFRDQYVVQNILIHSDENTTAELDSNENHIEFARRGLGGIIQKPLGHGPGTAGLVSIKNPAGGFLTENYYIQIGYEIGVLGLLIFAAASIWIYKLLLIRNTPLAICLIASFWGYLLVNMLLHIWSNEAVAAQWWLLAGLSMAPLIAKSQT